MPGYDETGRKIEMVTIPHSSPSADGIPRRAALALGLAAIAGAAGSSAQAEDAPKGIKITVLYNQPKDPAQFEKYYAETHMPMVYAVIKRVELALGIPGPSGAPPPFYRITELYFDSAEQLQQITATPDWKKIVDDVPNFASGGATVLISKIT
jgi:uncharacterized protein (TIGR02118 family)